MIIPEKTITDNPFVDNVLYYSKLMAMNCTVKDEEEALVNETPESLRRRELLISSVERTSTYEVYDSIPKEILEKYVALRTNIDLYGESIDALKAHMASYSLYRRTQILDELNKLAILVYMNHYEIMVYYLDEVGPSWFADNEALYNKCKKLDATYEDLFDILPKKTIDRIFEAYINNYDNTKLDDISASLDNFKRYIAGRTDPAINSELQKINEAMRNIFISHYDIMVLRGYVKDSFTRWWNFVDDQESYNSCARGTAKYNELYYLFPADERKKCLEEVLGGDVERYNLNDTCSNLDEYFESGYDPTAAEDTENLSSSMRTVYLSVHNMYLDNSIYNSCAVGNIDFYGLYDYLPVETRKMIVNSQVETKTNLQAYAESKNLFNSYLNTLPRDEKERLKAAILADLQTWYPTHHIETNNYYRALAGLPPLDKNGNVMEDTLCHTWDDNSESFIEFGNTYINRIPGLLYPEIHWKQQLCDFDAYDIGILEQYGVIDDYISACNADLNQIRYRYLKYLGDNALDIYTCSRAMNFQLVGIPTIDDSEFKRKFMDAYVVNRDYVIRTVYSDAYRFQSDYYNKFMIVFILINTIMDCLTSIPDYIIDREVFDSRCIKYLFESFGIPYYSEIPIKYQRAMLKNLNILIKYKASTRNMIDICSLFGFSDVRVFGYYLFKKRLVDVSTGEYLFDEDNDISYSLDELYVRDKTGTIQDYNGVRYTKLKDYRYYDADKYTKTIKCEDENGRIVDKVIVNNDADVYILDKVANDFIPLKDTYYFNTIKANTAPAELKFIKVPIDDYLTEYKNDEDYLVPYDEIVYQDEGDTWDGGEDHQHLINRLLDHEFNAVKTKYISVETITDMTELAFQVSYFYNMLFDNMYSEDALTIEIPYIKIGHKFRFMDVVCYLFSLMYLYNGLEDNIMYSPTQILYVKGYNFDSDLNEVLKDATAFQQNNPVTGEPYQDYQKYNIFDINERIAEDGYDYREAFKDYNMRAFNLECDIDALDKWLNDNFQMSLDDFVVDDTLTVFDHVITLRNFFSLNNSYYQKSIFTDNLLPSPYNQEIKYAFDYLLYTKIYSKDINDNTHEYVHEEDYYMDVISDKSEGIYIMNYKECIRIGINNEGYAIYYRYVKLSDGNFYRVDNTVFYKNQTTGDEFKKLFDGRIGIVDQDGNYIFAADHYYTKDEDGNYVEITDPKYFREDPNIKYRGRVKDDVAVVPHNGIVVMFDQPLVEDKEIVLKSNWIWGDIETVNVEDEGKQVLNFGQYYVYRDGQWILDPDNCYVKVERNGQIFYVLASEADQYKNIVVAEEDCYIRHSDGHFIRLTETDYYKKKQSGEDYNGYEYTEEDCFVITSEATEWYDPSADPRVYYKKLKDFYTENNYIIYTDEYYVKDSEGNYIPQSDLVDPNNCYYNDEGNMVPVIDSLARVEPYDTQDIIRYILIMQENNDYLKYKEGDFGTYYLYEDPMRRYVYNSKIEYITVLFKTATYKNTNSLIVVLNKALDKVEDDITDEKYNPEKTDGVWDENDWFYKDGYRGENMWYYKEPGKEDEEPEEELKDPVGSGFYLEASSYLGDIEFEEGARYYISLDIETNFTGNMQIACDADVDATDSQSRIYALTQGEELHISQVFIANDVKRPGLRFLIYEYEQNPIEIGDYIIISNLRVVRAYNDHYIAQDIPSYDRLQELYRTNEAIYKYLTGLMVNTDNIHMYRIYKKLYDSLMTSKYNKEAFKLTEDTYAKTFTDFLETRDSVLYERLCYFKSLDVDAMHKQVADNIVEVTYAIDDCVDTYSYAYLYSYFPAVSASYIQQYIIKIINFFKSWKVHLLGINTVYKFADPFENTVKILECHKYRDRFDFVKSNVFVYGSVKINPIDDNSPSGQPYSELYPDLVKYSHYLRDHYTIRDRVRLICTTADTFDHFYDSDGKLQLILNDETTEIDTKDDILKITSSSSFKAIDQNIGQMTTEEDEQDVFGIQHIGDINSYSTDIIEWRDLENEEDGGDE